MVLIFLFYTFKKYFVSKENTVSCTSTVPVLAVQNKSSIQGTAQ